MAGHVLSAVSEAAIDVGRPSDLALTRASPGQAGNQTPPSRLRRLLAGFRRVLVGLLPWNPVPPPGRETHASLLDLALTTLPDSIRQTSDDAKVRRAQFDILRTEAVRSALGWTPLLFHALYSMFRTLTLVGLAIHILLVIRLTTEGSVPDLVIAMAWFQLILLGSSLVLACMAAATPRGSKPSRRRTAARWVVPSLWAVSGALAVASLIDAARSDTVSGPDFAAVVACAVLPLLLARVLTTRMHHFAQEYADSVMRIAAVTGSRKEHA